MSNEIEQNAKVGEAAPAQPQMEKAYNPAAVEQKWYDFWEQHNYFKPDDDPTKESFTIIMPPPNVTGALHLGHALMASVEDVMVRWHRMQGKSVLWLPGSDHAGISGETAVEKEVSRTEHTTKQALGRDEFLKRVWKWMDEYRDVIVNQLRVLGASTDWTRKCFTMDPGPQRAVRTAFKRLYDEGLIYQAERIINWCPGSLTVLSDLEVNMKEEDGFLWYIRYPVVGEEGRYVTVATTRPETMLGDTGVAVHPNDPRYQDLHGKLLELPLMNRQIPVVADDAVEEFGTGAVKVTPAHDPLDFEIGQRHSLPLINMMNPNASINENGGKYAGLDRFAARKQVVADLEAGGYLVKTEPYHHSVPYSERANVPIEPLVSKQWWVKIQPLAAPALQAYYDGRIKFVPEDRGKVYSDWLENIHDWTISRQLWWGHRIPVWYCANQHQWATDQESASSCPTCQTTEIWQDPDVLDTWFSSGLWPMSTLGWPDQTPDLARFYPGSVMETGYDIIFLWVARMIMFGMYFMDGVPPYHTVYLHGTVRDDKGQRMSKTKGNGVDPLEAASKYGADALRFTLLTSSGPGMDTKFSVQRTEDSRNFANKIWNATRFITMSLNPNTQLESLESLQNRLAELPLADRWILSLYNKLNSDINGRMEAYEFAQAGGLLYDFLWGDFCDWYIEASKIRLNSPDPAIKAQVQAVLLGVLERTLRLLHPFMPFLTEELWHNLPHEGEALIVAKWPQAGPVDMQALTEFKEIQDGITKIRNLKTQAREETNRNVTVIIWAKPEIKVLYQREAELVVRLAGVNASTLQITDTLETPPAQALKDVTAAATTIYLVREINVEAERTRLNKEVDSVKREIEKSESTLGKPGFADRAPAAVVAKERERLATAQERLAKLQASLSELD
jgi:valyl-tRNA synthetase